MKLRDMPPSTHLVHGEESTFIANGHDLHGQEESSAMLASLVSSGSTLRATRDDAAITDSGESRWEEERQVEAHRL